LRKSISSKDFDQVAWNPTLEEACRELVRMAIREDLGPLGDCTTQALVPEGVVARASVVVRRAGVVAGIPAVPIILQEFDPDLQWFAETADGQWVKAGQTIGRIEGPASALLTGDPSW
jgi:nicotinate-nucleotide pyrophosphorylase (carboxylating)